MNKMMHSPEPMSLGSPTQSPPVNNQFLPQFLLGDMPSNNQVSFFDKNLLKNDRIIHNYF
jgi:hypothetical protein